MYAKLIVLPALIAAVSAGYVGTPLAASVVAAPVVKAYSPLYGGIGYGHGGYGHGGYGLPVATSYANTYKVSHSVPVIKTVAAPYSLGYSHGLGYSGLGYGHDLGYGHGLYGSSLGYGQGYGYGHGLYGNSLGYGHGYGLY